jgi:uncharacterized membrane protein YphA (DoxX/SURF4 family)
MVDHAFASDPEREPSDVSPVAQVPRWRPETRFAFRFAFLYLALVIYPFPLEDLLNLDIPDPWISVVPWLGRHLFHLEITTKYFGGDSLYGYALGVFLLTLAALGAVVWSLLDRKRAHYESLYSWLRLWVQLYLGVMLIGYGMAKVLPFQMLPPSLSRLMMRLGDLSPQSLAWVYMGSSIPYTRFTGLIETGAGILLFVPRLARLGALIAVGALAHVFMINMSYDVNVKRLSFNLLLMSLFLAAPELPRLANVFVFNRRVEPVTRAPLFQRKWLNHAILAAQLIFGCYVLAGRWVFVFPRHKNYEALPQTVPFYGIWTVEDFVLNGQTRPPLVTDDVRWNQVIFDVPDTADVPLENNACYPGMAIMSMSGSRILYWMQFDKSRNAMGLMKLDDEKNIAALFPPPFQADATFSVEQVQAERLRLDGVLDGQHIRTTLRRTQVNFLLRNRGFHWIINYTFWGR